MGDSLIHHGETTDRLIADPHLAKIVEGELQRMLGIVTPMIERYQAYVMAIAMTLVQKRVLTGTEVYTIMETVAEIEAQARDAMTDSATTDEPDAELTDQSTVH